MKERFTRRVPSKSIFEPLVVNFDVQLNWHRILRSRIVLCTITIISHPKHLCEIFVGYSVKPQESKTGLREKDYATLESVCKKFLSIIFSQALYLNATGKIKFNP
jgi:hypothetical protein